jgi:hypothetical protein
VQRVALILAVAFCALAMVQPSHAQSLFGETLTATTLDAVTVTPAECASVGGGTFSFSATGVATGPYPGTFEATGTYVIGAHPLSSISTDVSYSETFTIYSGTTKITGTKEVATGDTGPYLQGASGQCETFLNSFGQHGRVVWGSGLMRYEAAIDDGARPTYVTGLSGTNALDERYDECCPGPVPNDSRFGETFVTSSPLLSLTPAIAENPVASEHTVTATVEGASGQLATVYFVVAGSVSTTGSCTTNEQGVCTFTYAGPTFSGVDLITGCVDRDDSGTIDPGEPCAEATKIWVLPATTPGQATGGGWIATEGATVSFGFNATSTTGSGLAKGNCNLIDDGTRTHIKCLTVEALVVGATHATFFGTATVNGVLTRYRIDVNDFGEPGTLDTFEIHTGSGYTAAGTLDGGNIQIRAV